MNLKLAIIIPLILILLISTVPASSAFHPEHESWLGSQHYIDRYNNEENYRKWFDTYYGSNYTSIYEAVGVQEPWYLTEIRNQKEMILAQAQVLQQILDQLQDQSKLIRAFNEPVSNMAQEPGSQGSDPLIAEQMKKLNERLDKQEHEITSLNKTMSMAQEPGSQAAQSHNYPEWSDPVIVAEKKKLHKEIFSYKDEFDLLASQLDGYSWDWNFSEPHIGDTAFTITTLEMYKMSVVNVQDRIDDMKQKILKEKQKILDDEEERKRDEEERKRDEEERKRDEMNRIAEQKRLDLKNELSDAEKRAHLYREHYKSVHGSSSLGPSDGVDANVTHPSDHTTYDDSLTHQQKLNFWDGVYTYYKSIWLYHHPDELID